MDGFERIVYQAMGEPVAHGLPFLAAFPTGARQAQPGPVWERSGRPGRPCSWHLLPPNSADPDLAAWELPHCTSNFSLSGCQVLDWRVGAPDPTRRQGLRFREVPECGDRNDHGLLAPLIFLRDLSCWVWGGPGMEEAAVFWVRCRALATFLQWAPGRLPPLLQLPAVHSFWPLPPAPSRLCVSLEAAPQPHMLAFLKRRLRNRRNWPKLRSRRF